MAWRTMEVAEQRMRFVIATTSARMRALGTKTPASVWHPSQRPYQPKPSDWNYPPGAELARLDPHGRLRFQGRNWQISGPLAGEPVQLIRLHQRILVFYRHSLVRELDPVAQGSTAVEPWTTTQPR